MSRCVTSIISGVSAVSARLPSAQGADKQCGGLCCSRRNIIILSVASLLISGLVSCHATTDTGADRSPRLAGSSINTTSSCSGDSDCSGAATSSGRSRIRIRSRAQIRKEGTHADDEQDNQSANHPSAALVSGQQSLAMELASAEAPWQRQLEEQTATELYPSQSQPTTAEAGGIDRWRAFNKCNSSEGPESEEQRLDKQLANPIRARTDDRCGRRRIRRHIEVGHADPLAGSSPASRMFVGHHQTSFFASSSPWPFETGLFSWPRGERQRRHPSSSSVGRTVKRKRPSLEKQEPLIGSVDGQLQQRRPADPVARGPTKAAVAREVEEEDDDDVDVEVEVEADRAIKYSQPQTSQVGRDTSQASSDVAASVSDSGLLRSAKRETVRKIRSGQVGQQLDLFKVDGGDYYRPSHGEADQQEHHRRVAGSEDDQIISHYNLIELLDDDLFLAKGSRLVRHSPSELHDLIYSSHRRPALASSSLSSSSLVLDKLRTIYFGGFFPWLADEDTHLNDNGAYSYAGTNNDEAHQHQRQASHNRSSVNGNSSSLERRLANNEAASSDSKDPSMGRDERPWPSMTRQRKQQQQQQRRKKQQSETGADESIGATAATKLNPFSSNGIGQVSPPGSVSSSLDGGSYDNRHQLGRFILPAVRLALDHINKNSSILATYKLEIVPRDTQCNATISLKEFFDMVYEEPKKMLLYGDACRVSTDPIAKASYFFDLIQISYADTDPIYTIENYPNFFRVVPSENALSLARIPFIRNFNWTRVGTIYQNLPRYSLPHSKLLTDLERFKIVIKQSVSLPGSIDGLQNRDLGDELRKLKEKDVRIILGNFDEQWALLLFCEAYREKMTGRKYQWILTGVSEDKLWQHYLKKGSECSEQELLIAMDGYIITDITPVTRSQQPTISGMMAHEYSNEYRQRAREMNIAIEENKFYGYVYDGIWAIALALHRVDSQLRYYNRLLEAGKAKLNPELEGISSLLDFDYHKPIWVKLIRNALNKTRFNGVTGTVSFYKNERPGLISFSQFQAFRDMNEVIIGSYDALNDELDLKVGFPIFWRGSSPPIDYTIERVTPFRINRTLFVIISIFALFGIVLATVFLTINIKFRNQRYIKMSSPYLNNLIIVGCILTYTSVIILGLDSGLTSELNFPYICNARAWVLMAGFTLAFGSMFSKTFRVHSIFTNIKLHKKVIKDYKLFMVVFILLTFDVCILIVWQYFDPFYRETNNGTSIQDPDNEDIIIVPEMEHCQSKRMTIFLSVIYVYKGLLMAFGCFLAWETRHVSIPALNDSKYIGLSVYNVVIMCVIGAGLSFVLRDQQDASFVIISIFIIFCSTTTLCLVFVPKLIELKQNPRAGDHRVRATLKTFKKNYHEEAFGAAGCRDIHGNIIGRGYGINLNERIKILLDENTKQRSSLKEKTYELEALTYKYRKIQGMIQSGQYLQALTSTGSAISTNPKQATSGSKSLVGSELLTPKSTTTHLATKNQNQSTSGSPEVATQLSDLTMAAARSGNQLEKSPIMSSATQITTTTATTTTTSSTNNTTDLMSNDYCSSSKPTSRFTSATGNCCAEGADKLAVAFECGPPSLPTDSAPSAKEAPGRAQRSAIVGKKRAMIASDITKQSPKYTADSSYCSMGAEYELSDVRKLSQANLNLFNVLSYIEDGTREDNEKYGGDRNADERMSRGEYVESKFNRWSAGPFCTLMVRNTADQQAANNGSTAVAARPISPMGRLTNNDTNGESPRSCKASEEIRASCPDIAATASLKSIPSKSARQSALHRQNNRAPATATTGAAATTVANKTSLASRGRLPRTISMIEYLGLSDFDFIARRHDKLVKGRLVQSARKKQLDYCCIDENNHCSCCDQSAGNKCPTQSEADMVFSSGESANSGDLVRTGSPLSCSTCCSLMTPSYVSHYDYMFDEVSHSSGSVSTEQSSSSSSNDSGSLSPMNCNSNSSKSPTPSSNYENKESVIINNSTACSVCQEVRPGNQQQAASCSHHKRALHTHHEHGHNASGKLSASCQHVDLSRTPANQAIVDGQHPLCTSGTLYGPGTKEDANCSGQVCANKSTRTGRISFSRSNNFLGDLAAADSDQEQQETSIIKCDIVESL